MRCTWALPATIVLVTSTIWGSTEVATSAERQQDVETWVTAQSTGVVFIVRDGGSSVEAVKLPAKAVTCDTCALHGVTVRPQARRATP